MLRPKQILFIKEYLVDLNGAQAAIRAGYSAKTARITASQLLTKPNIQAAIQAEMDKRAEKTSITAERVLEEIARIAFLDIRKAFDVNGNLLPIHEMPEDVARAMGGMDISSYTGQGEGAITEITKKIKLIDKKGALELLGKHLKLFTEKVEHTGKDGGAIEIADINEVDMARKIAFVLAQGAEQCQKH